ncbi:hypothetical protein BHE74_00031893 [Ensete ventricosum]|uniref:Uncharacterized protein n=1 Tax=Ensete ventricosum TaxID=4639 RepID=A0A444BXJ7_ENSVE|nr:hypothetical protein B296_00054222 [Ensete ventricosum]RWV78361.1 hypothetical protein GW17_00060685 [Ensete ventricosum]RWV78363.1 hypothetical protein GW17_00060683 [Ensete ventricosum]RWW61064.1 hypothetical protein BHE74_00031893 [Ensete ventricosum]RZS27251.1 hypothetical protein BHM03_00060691 [Ensete ventricosum]
MYGHLIHLKCLSEDIVRDGWFGSEDSTGDGDRPGVLAAESRKRDGVPGAMVELEVDQALGEHKHITLVEHFGEELVVGVGGDESHVERAFQHRQYLRRPGMGVGRVKAVRCEIHSSHGDAEGVEAGNSVHVHERHVGADFVRGVARLVETGEEEVFGFDQLRILAG